MLLFIEAVVTSIKGCRSLKLWCYLSEADGHWSCNDIYLRLSVIEAVMLSEIIWCCNCSNTYLRLSGSEAVVLYLSESEVTGHEAAVLPIGSCWAWSCCATYQKLLGVKLQCYLSEVAGHEAVVLPIRSCWAWSCSATYRKLLGMKLQCYLS